MVILVPIWSLCCRHGHRHDLPKTIVGGERREGAQKSYGVHVMSDVFIPCSHILSVLVLYSNLVFAPPSDGNEAEASVNYILVVFRWAHDATDVCQYQCTCSVLPNLSATDLAPECPSIGYRSPGVLVLDAWTLDIRIAVPGWRLVGNLIRQACAVRSKLEAGTGRLFNSMVLIKQGNETSVYIDMYIFLLLNDKRLAIRGETII